MASASSTSARSLFIESKMRLADRVQVNVNNIASLARQIQRGSKSSEVILFFDLLVNSLILYYPLNYLIYFIINAYPLQISFTDFDTCSKKLCTTGAWVRNDGIQPEEA